MRVRSSLIQHRMAETLEDSCTDSCKGKPSLPSGLVITLLCIYADELKKCVPRKMCMNSHSVLTAQYFPRLETDKTPLQKQLGEQQSSHTMKYHSAIKRCRHSKAMESHKCTSLSKRSQLDPLPKMFLYLPKQHHQQRNKC